ADPPDPAAARTAVSDSTVPAAQPAAFLGLRTAKYTARDLGAAKEWYRKVLGVDPYFDQPFYVGFNVGGFELGITPDSAAPAERAEAGVAYWGVEDADATYARLLSLGAAPFEPIQDVGEGIRIGAVRDPFGNILGVIRNPHFTLPAK
ncbi:MAG TPA: VOC family protein, partial [Gemmatimonadales bacterium]|nr:VOC family protein [Gemmatimonadales bacterium]